MKLRIASICTILLLGATACLKAVEPEQASASPEFERMKSLVGSWKGTVDLGEGPIEMVLQYRLLAAGSVLEERCFAGTPNEMVSMYYVKNGRLAMTHYCVMGNRPGMMLKSAGKDTLRFDFDPSCGINPAKESHMHALAITFVDHDTITSSCQAMIDGKTLEKQPTILKRIKS